MPMLLFLTGAHGSGKSTLARRLVDERPLSLLLDIDTVRSQLGDWGRDPTAAGTVARRLALAMARTHLAAGADVVVPQFVQRPELIRQLAQVATDTRSTFTVVALVSSPAEAAGRFRRRAGSADPNHVAAQELQAAAGAQPIEELYTAMLAMLAGFPETIYVDSVPDEIDLTLDELRRAIDGGTGN